MGSERLTSARFGGGRGVTRYRAHLEGWVNGKTSGLLNRRASVMASASSSLAPSANLNGQRDRTVTSLIMTWSQRSIPAGGTRRHRSSVVEHDNDRGHLFFRRESRPYRIAA